MRNLLLAALLFTSASLAAEVEPGNWELTLTTSLPGADKPTAVTQARCLTLEDAKDPSRVVGARGGCEFSNRKDTGSVFSFDVNCSGQVPMHGSGAVRYSAQTIDADLDLAADNISIGGQKFRVRSRVAGRRLGPCN